MLNLSRGEKEAMIAAFSHHFNVPREVAQAPSAVEWMSLAPKGIVEYDGSLKGESPKDRDKRMEIIGIYDGDITELVSYLRYKFKQHKKLQKWALIFQIYNDINAVKSVIEQATTESVFGKSAEQSDMTPTEVVQNNPVTSTEQSSTAVQEVVNPEAFDMQVGVVSDMNASSHEEQFVESAVASSMPTEDNTPTGVDTVVTAEVVETPHHTDDTVVTPSGNVHDETESQLYKENNNKQMEVSNMSDLNNLLAAAQGAQSANPAEVQKAPENPNVSPVKADVKAAQRAVYDSLASEKEARNNWTRSNVVTALVSVMAPAATRKLADVGTVGTETDPAKQTQAITERVNGFIANVTGKPGTTVDQFEAMTDSERYANVVPGSVEINGNTVDNVAKAKAIYELLKQVQQNPSMQVPAFIPANLSYPTKGYVVGGQPMSQDEFIVTLMDNSNGAVYGEGGVNAEGNEIEGATSFKITTAKKTEKAQAGAISTQQFERRKIVVRIKNKKSFIEGGKNVVYLFTKVDEQETGKASFRAAVNVNGVLVAASVSVFKLDAEGKKIANPANPKTGDVTYKKKQASVSVSVPVTKMVKEFSPEFKGDMDTAIAADRWGVTMATAKSAQGDFCNIKEFTETPIYDVFVQAYAGNLTYTNGIKGSNSLKSLRAIADQAAADAAADAANELA